MISPFLQYDFMLLALAAGLLMALLSGVIGNFVVSGRQAMMSDMLAHASLAGVGIGVFFQISLPLAVAGVICVIAVLLWIIKRRFQFPPEAMAVLIMSGSLALALLLTHMAKSNTLSFENFLFGSILTVSGFEVALLAAVSAVVLGVTLFFWNELLVAVIDSEFAATRSIRAHYFELIFLLLLGFSTGVALKIIGGLLIGAMLVIPPLCVQHQARSFMQSVFLSVLINVASVCSGLLASFYFDIPASSAIVLCLLIIFFAILLIRYARQFPIFSFGRS